MLVDTVAAPIEHWEQPARNYSWYNGDVLPTVGGAMNTSNRAVQSLANRGQDCCRQGTSVRSAVRRVAAAGGALAALAALAVTVPVASVGSSFVNWPSYLDGVTHHSYAAQATAITPSDGPSLGEAW